MKASSSPSASAAARLRAADWPTLRSRRKQPDRQAGESRGERRIGGIVDDDDLAPVRPDSRARAGIARRPASPRCRPRAATMMETDGQLRGRARGAHQQAAARQTVEKGRRLRRRQRRHAGGRSRGRAPPVTDKPESKCEGRLRSAASPSADASENRMPPPFARDPSAGARRKRGSVRCSSPTRAPRRRPLIAAAPVQRCGCRIAHALVLAACHPSPTLGTALSGSCRSARRDTAAPRAALGARADRPAFRSASPRARRPLPQPRHDVRHRPA